MKNRRKPSDLHVVRLVQPRVERQRSLVRRADRFVEHVVDAGDLGELVSVSDVDGDQCVEIAARRVDRDGIAGAFDRVPEGVTHFVADPDGHVVFGTSGSNAAPLFWALRREPDATPTAPSGVSLIGGLPPAFGPAGWLTMA